MRTPPLALVVVPALTAGLIAQQPYGDPTPGAGGFLPSLAAPGPWIGNASFGFDVRCTDGSAGGFLAFSAAAVEQTTFGFQLLLDPTAVIGSAFFLTTGSGPGQGSARVAFPLTFPPTPNFVGWPFYSQAIVLDPASPGGTFAASNGVRVELGLAPLLFVGCSIANNDPFQLIDPQSGIIVDSGSPPEVDNSTGAVFTDGGRRLFVGSSIRGTIGMGVVTTPPVVWTTFFTGGGAVYGLAADPRRQWLWALASLGAGRELVAFDVNPNSAGFGQVRANTVGVANGNYERWALSATGRRAAVLTYLPNSLTVVDTDDNSPTFLSRLVTAISIPLDQVSPLQLASRVAITPDDRYVMVLMQHAGAMGAEIAKYDLLTSMWVDHNPGLPGAQNIGPLSQPPASLGSAPTTLHLATDGSFAIVSGFGACGWVGRLDLDPKAPTFQSYTPWTVSASLQNSWTAALSADETEVAVGTWPGSGCAPMPGPQVLRLDATTGALLSIIPIPPNSNGGNQNLYTLLYR